MERQEKQNLMIISAEVIEIKEFVTETGYSIDGGVFKLLPEDEKDEQYPKYVEVSFTGKACEPSKQLKPGDCCRLKCVFGGRLTENKRDAGSNYRVFNVVKCFYFEKMGADDVRFFSGKHAPKRQSYEDIERDMYRSKGAETTNDGWGF